MFTFYFRDDEVFSRREIDAQKRVIFEIKSPFNLRLEPEFSTGSPVGERCRELIDAADEMTRRLYCVVDWLTLHPEYNPKTKVIPKKDYPVLVDVTF